MSVPCLFAIEFGVLEFWLCRSVLKHSINKRNQSQGLPIDISVQLQACFCSYPMLWWKYIPQAVDSEGIRRTKKGK